MNQFNNQNNQNYKNQDLTKLFKEVQDIRYGRKNAEKIKVPKVKKEIKYNRITVVDKKFNIIGGVLGTLFIIGFFTLINSKAIFATTIKEKIAIGKFEENNSPIDVMQVLSDNISDTVKKEIVTKKVDINYETEYRENSNLPTGEENILQNGINGEIEQTLIISFENNIQIDEKIISEEKVSDAINEIIEKGTSDYLAAIKAHIGDTLYTKVSTELKNEPNSNADNIGNIYQFIDVTLKEIDGDYALVNVDGFEGYVKTEDLTSSTINPEMVENARIQRIFLTVNKDMEINKPSGLTRDDFIKVLSNNSADVNKIFENNAGFFYDIEQKYNVNGLFLAAMGIHESNWGTSTISINKKNLFGYGSYDSSAYASSYTFETYQYGIELVAKVLSKYYINPQGTSIYDGETAVGSYYNGSTIAGVNTRYASDANWQNRVYDIMKSLYKKLAE